jgi:hypothetical protein
MPKQSARRAAIGWRQGTSKGQIRARPRWSFSCLVMHKLERALQLLHAERIRFVASSNGLLSGFAPPINAASNAGS